MKCSKCKKEFDEADKKLDYKRLSASSMTIGDVRKNGITFVPRYYPILSYGVGEFPPLCCECYNRS